MKKTSKALNLIVLTVFVGSNLLTPISYAVDDLPTIPQSGDNLEIQLVPSVSEGGGTLLMI